MHNYCTLPPALSMNFLLSLPIFGDIIGTNRGHFLRAICIEVVGVTFAVENNLIDVKGPKFFGF